MIIKDSSYFQNIKNACQYPINSQIIGMHYCLGFSPNKVFFPVNAFIPDKRYKYVRCW